MLNVLTNLVVGLVMVANPDIDGNVAGDADELTLADGDESSELPEDTAPRAWECAYGSEREDYNYCLVQCEGDFTYTEILGFTIADTSRNREYCRRAGRRYCEQFEQRVDDTCWGHRVW